MDQSSLSSFPELLRESLSRAGFDEAWFTRCLPEDIPVPCRELLVHEVDMTSTLERHYGEPMHLEVLVDGRANGYYFREVVLRGAETGRAAEFGLIEIELNRFPDDLQRAILSGGQPLGGLLNENGVTYKSRPIGYFSVARGILPTKLSALGKNDLFYGRFNQLIGSDGSCLARILEILPDSHHP